MPQAWALWLAARWAAELPSCRAERHSRRPQTIPARRRFQTLVLCLVRRMPDLRRRRWSLSACRCRRCPLPNWRWLRRIRMRSISYLPNRPHRLPPALKICRLMAATNCACRTWRRCRIRSHNSMRAVKNSRSFRTTMAVTRLHRPTSWHQVCWKLFPNCNRHLCRCFLLQIANCQTVAW